MVSNSVNPDQTALQLLWYRTAMIPRLNVCVLFIFSSPEPSLTGPQIRVRNRKLFFLFLNQNICCGYSKEPSQRDGSFELPKHMFTLMGNKMITFSSAEVFKKLLWQKSVDPDQTALIGAVCSGSTLFASILNSSVMLGNYLQQTTSADNIFGYFFFGAFRVKEHLLNN